MPFNSLVDLQNTFKFTNQLKMSRYIPILLLAISFIFPQTGSIIYLVFVLLIESYIYLLDALKNPLRDYKLAKRKYNESEIKIFSKYYIFYRFPTTSSYLSMMFTNYIFSSIILIPWLFYKSEYIQMGLILLNIPLCYRFSVFLRPLHFANTKPESRIGKERDLIKCVYDKYVWDKTPDGELIYNKFLDNIRKRWEK